MASTTSDAEQQDLLHCFTSPAHQAALLDEGAASASGESTDTAIWISDDDSSDTEDEDDVEGHDLDNSQSCCTTPTTASAADHLDSTGAKHSVTQSDTAVCMGTMPVLSPARVEGVRILSHESHMDIPADPESNQQALRPTNCTPIGDTTAGADAGSGASPISPESQPCLGTSDEQQLVTGAIRATSEPGMMIDALDDEKSCHGSQNAPATPSINTHSPIAATPEVMAQTPLHDSEVSASTSRDDAIPGARNTSPAVGLEPESRQDQNLDHGSCSPSDTESESSEAESGSLPGARMSPPPQELLSRRRSRGTSPRIHTTVQDKDSDLDTEGSGSEDGLDVPDCIRDEEYCPSPPEVQGHDSGDDSEDEEHRCRKRQRVSRSSHASTRRTPASARSSRQRQSTRRTAQLPRGRRTSVCGGEGPAPSQARPIPSDASTFLARFEEWPLRDVSLKRITEGDKTTFQLQFEWTPDPSQPHANRPVCSPHKGGRPLEVSVSAAKSSGDKWTPDEEDTVRRMREDGCSWVEIQRALPHRSQGSIQVRYSTKLKQGR
ncbi:hypothetical protein F53441_8881 [Fusarium austroafricanum]|uniref:Myb-like domain-containing protein n=1 Tax=Fusarium austroafricanum TaxID=2364996 RepID=A0A8H4NWX5_9HYPO|nr:hypothetical protein F53441_8881 [Fusarium austroafricanum]